METVQRILVVIDPTQDHYPALERALRMVQLAKRKVHLVFLLLASEQTRKADELTRITAPGDWFREQIHDPATALGIEYTVHISWSRDWSSTVLHMEQREQVELSIISFYGRNSEHTLSDANWKVLRESTKPILIARRKDGDINRTVLAAIKSQDENYAERNAALLEGAHTLADTFDIQLHVVNAYSDSMDYPDRAKVAQLAGVPNERVHIKVGEPQDVICDVANELDADALLISSQRRTGLQGMLRGNTVEKIIDKVGRDVLMM